MQCLEEVAEVFDESCGLLHSEEVAALLRAREVRGEEKSRWWLIAEREWPCFAEFRVKAGDREIPVMVLEPDAREGGILMA